MSTTTVVATGGFVLVTVGLVGMNVSELAQRRINNEQFREALWRLRCGQMRKSDYELFADIRRDIRQVVYNPEVLQRRDEHVNLNPTS